jgi:uncharacterized membrane protein YbhN (UPF0104 family)
VIKDKMQFQSEGIWAADKPAESGAVRRRRLWWLARGLATLALAGFLVWRVRGQLGAVHLSLARPAYLALALGCMVSAIMLSTGLWYVLLPRPRRVLFRHLVAHYLLGQVWNNVLPSGMGGDAVRAIALRNDLGRADVAVSSVLMARVCGLWSVVLLALVSACLYTVRQGLPSAWPWLLVSLGALGLALGGTALLLGAPVEGLVRRLPRWLNGWYARLRAYRGQPSILLAALTCAITIQLCAIAINACLSQALALPISTVQLLLSLPLINLAVLLPISIGGLGAREGSYVVLLGLLGVSAVDALVLSLAVYVSLVLVTAAGAGVCILLSPRPTTDAGTG